MRHTDVTYIMVQVELSEAHVRTFIINSDKVI
jgi:hypothetical protein